MSIRLSLVCSACDRTQRIIDGRIRIAGTETTVAALPAEEMFARAFDHAEFDVTELSFSNFIRLTARDACAYIGIPVFPSRTFRHAAIYIRTDRGIADPTHLRGRTVGVREYSNTATLVAKGLLADDFGVDARDIRWRVGDIDAVERATIPVPALASGFDVSAVDEGQLLSDMLRDGEIDALISYHPPACFGAPGVPVARLFPDYAAAEADYFRRTRIFPIMHLMAIRRDIARRYPSLPRAIFDAFVAAKDAAFDDLAAMQSVKVALPWAHAEFARTRAIMGDDYWPYGIAANAPAIESLLRYANAQGLVAQPPTIAEMFEPSLHAT